MKPQIWDERGIPHWDSGGLFIGDQGMLLADYGKHTLLPQEKFKDFQRPTPFIPESLGHYREWIQGCKTGAPTTCHLEYSGAFTEANHLGNGGYRMGQKIELWSKGEWDRAIEMPPAEADELRAALEQASL